ncbi:MAG: endonuclease/exonuclease/phosphatase family protein [Flavobacteriales bacterium]|nr:endonuclease/exonuclease/phosphatase family protein [Flavobacteriales bacterium]
MNRSSFGILWALALGLIASSISSVAQTVHPLEVVFYNVENLYDTEDDPLVDDNEFLPDSANKWTMERYEKKLSDLAKVLKAASEDGLPEVIGLCEIENRKVVEDLFATAPLNEAKFVVVHEDSPDKRGIDVALIYHAERLKELYHEKIRYSFDFEPETTTRDILYVKLLSGIDTLHFFVNHWPSRRGGQEASQPKRLKAASMLLAKTDSILAIDPKAKIVAMGDFNDYPNNRSMTEVLNSTPGANGVLTNLTYAFHDQGLGTYNYKGEWGMLDQFIVSQGVMNSEQGLSTLEHSISIVKEDWMLFKQDGKEPAPSRTYGGPNYYGGYSDHLPIRMIMFGK